VTDKERFDDAKQRLESIVTEARRKDTTLEKAIDLLEEGVKLANVCTERIDETGWREEEAAADAHAGSATPAAKAGRARGDRGTQEPTSGEGEPADPVLE
jgi:exodeoxyribonuclease VII small subunit